MTAQFPTFIVTASTPTMLNGTFGAHRVFGSEEAVADIASAVASHAKRPAVVTICVHECIGHNGGGKPMAGRQVATLARMADGSFAVAWGIEVPGLPHLTLGRHAFGLTACPTGQVGPRAATSAWCGPDAALGPRRTAAGQT